MTCLGRRRCRKHDLLLNLWFPLVFLANSVQAYLSNSWLLIYHSLSDGSGGVPVGQSSFGGASVELITYEPQSSSRWEADEVEWARGMGLYRQLAQINCCGSSIMILFSQYELLFGMDFRVVGSPQCVLFG